jgi:hypothetical protein
VCYEPDLIVFYAKHEVAAVRADPNLIERAFGKTVQELADDREFTPARDFVETQKRYIEGHRAKLETGSSRTQIGGCLKLLLGEAMFPEPVRSMFEHKVNVQQKLLIEMYGANWSGIQREHFDYMFKNLLAWKSLFLSYTNGSAREINERFKKVIVCRVDRKRWIEDRYTDNLLAETIVKSLEIRNLQSYFYDKKAIGVGDNLVVTIKPAVENVFAFIQLVQTETFNAAAGGNQNWCFEEWKMFSDADQHKLNGRAYFADIFAARFAPVLTHAREHLRPAAIPEHYAPWRDLIFAETHHLQLDCDPKKFDAAMRNLAGKLVKLQDDIVTTVPD